MTRRILVADDHPLIREHPQGDLEIDGYEVETASDGLAALAAARARLFHLAITDLRMPDMGGIELLTAIRSEGLPLGVILLTGHGRYPDRARGHEGRGRRLVSKPYELRPPPFSLSSGSSTGDG